MNTLRFLQPRYTSPSEKVYKKLVNGIFCIYKPPNTDISAIHKIIKYTLVNGVNSLETRKVNDIVQVDNDINKIVTIKDEADTIEAVGHRFIFKDFKINYLDLLSEHDSGLISK
jgi:hypothetical protein